MWDDRDIQNTVADLNTEEQLFDKGIDSEGDSLGNYSPVSVEVYGKPEGHIRLEDTGDFYRSFKVRRKGNDFTIYADSIKKSDAGELTDLTEEFGIDIIGLTDESKEVLSKLVKSKILDIIREML